MIIKQTTLDLNGPELIFTSHPSSATINQGGSTTMTGTAVAAFSSQDPPNPATNTGSISYQWYAINIFGRIAGVYTQFGLDPSPADSNSGHGTHVAITLAGDGSGDAAGKGIAPAAYIVAYNLPLWQHPPSHLVALVVDLTPESLNLSHP